MPEQSQFWQAPAEPCNTFWLVPAAAPSATQPWLQFMRCGEGGHNA